jgi:hypothetical protein
MHDRLLWSILSPARLEIENNFPNIPFNGEGRFSNLSESISPAKKLM